MPDEPSGRAMCLEFNLRDDFVSQVVVPRDLTQREAKRLCAMIRTLPLSFVPEDVSDAD